MMSTGCGNREIISQLSSHTRISTYIYYTVSIDEYISLFVRVSSSSCYYVLIQCGEGCITLSHLMDHSDAWTI